MKAKYSTGSDTWIVDVMENDTVITLAEADSEGSAMAMARTSASAFYGSRAAMFEYAVYPPSPRTTKSAEEESTLEELREWVVSKPSGVPAGAPREYRHQQRVFDRGDGVFPQRLKRCLEALPSQ